MLLLALAHYTLFPLPANIGEPHYLSQRERMVGGHYALRTHKLEPIPSVAFLILCLCIQKVTDQVNYFLECWPFARISIFLIVRQNNTDSKPTSWCWQLRFLFSVFGLTSHLTGRGSIPTPPPPLPPRPPTTPTPPPPQNISILHTLQFQGEKKWNETIFFRCFSEQGCASTLHTCNSITNWDFYFFSVVSTYLFKNDDFFSLFTNLITVSKELSC